MSWSPELPIGEFRPWPDTVHVVRGRTGETLRYVPERTCRNASYRIDESRFHCSACEFGCWVKDVADGRDKLPKFCPSCGRRVVE